MKIINKTDWNTKQLRKILVYGLKREGMLGKNLTVEVVHSKCSDKLFVGGYAYFGKGDYSSHSFICLKMPDFPTAQNILSTFKHELAHTRGIRHKDMFDKHPDISVEEITSSAIPLVLGKNVKPEKPVLSVIEKRKLKAERMLKKWQDKAKKAKSLEIKWAKKVKYYQGL